MIILTHRSCKTFWSRTVRVLVISSGNKVFCPVKNTLEHNQRKVEEQLFGGRALTIAFNGTKTMWSIGECPTPAIVSFVLFVIVIINYITLIINRLKTNIINKDMGRYKNMNLMGKIEDFLRDYRSNYLFW